MRFKTSGVFETEALIDVVQRLVAQLQDANVQRVTGVNVYLSVIDKAGTKRTLTLGGEAIDTITLECSDLTLPDAEPKLQLGAAPTARSAPGHKPKRRRS
ncbi:MAG: hypothetical protein AAFY64_12225 [Pseudomonadota bacterium]